VGGVYDDSRPSTNGPPDAKGSANPIVGVSASFGAAILGRLSDLSATTYLERHGYTQLMVHTDDARQTEPVASSIKAMSFAVFDRADLLARLHLTFAILTGGLGAIGGIALLVAAVGIANTMIMTILERTREIGIMKALGAEPGTVRRLFLTETALVGLIGGVVGLLLAALASVVGNAIFRIWMTGQGYTPPGNLFVIAPTLIVGALVLAAAISLIAGAWPSRRAVRLQPLDALRYE
jgi:putative ABC transport system permease protein